MPADPEFEINVVEKVTISSYKCSFYFLNAPFRSLIQGWKFVKQKINLVWAHATFTPQPLYAQSLQSAGKRRLEALFIYLQIVGNEWA